MNPYDFVRIEEEPGTRCQPLLHERYEGCSGRFRGTIKTLTPLFIRGHTTDRSTTPQPFLCSPQSDYIIPGTSLKGLIRYVVETVDGGFFWFCTQENKLPSQFRRTSDLEKLDAACRLFGFLNGGQVLAGHVGFEDAICSKHEAHDPIYTPILSTPKPRHEVWYLDEHRRYVRGRKFYFHAQQIRTARGWLPPRSHPGNRQNQRIHPIGRESEFVFSGHFSSVLSEDFALLLYALELEPEMRHKMGYAKPAGLGSVEIRLTQLELVDKVTRYRAGADGITCLEGNKLRQYIQKRIKPYTENRTSRTLQDLRRIWHWPPQHDNLVYPDQRWFENNPQTPISDTP